MRHRNQRVSGVQADADYVCLGDGGHGWRTNFALATVRESNIVDEVYVEVEWDARSALSMKARDAPKMPAAQQKEHQNRAAQDECRAPLERKIRNARHAAKCQQNRGGRGDQ